MKKKYSIRPIENQDLWDFYKKVTSQIWLADAVNTSDDRFDSLHPTQQRALKMLLFFFANSDKVVADNLALNMMQQEDMPMEAQFFYAYQLFNENVHCVSYDTQILTNNGYFSIGDLEGDKVKVWNGKRFTETTITQTGIQKLYKVELSNGLSLVCTKGHRWFLRTGNQKHPELCKKSEKRTYELSEGDVIHDYNLPIIRQGESIKNPYIQGFFSADGTYSNGYPVIGLYGKKIKLYEEFEQPKPSREANLVRFYITGKIDYPKDYVPINSSLEDKLEWLAGVLDGDGCVNYNRQRSATSIQLAMIDDVFLKKVSLLLTTLGVKSTLRLIKDADKKLLPDGKGGHSYYNCKTLHCLYISTFGCTQLINLGLRTRRLDLRGDDSIKPKRELLRVVSIVDTGRKEMTYCFNEKEEGAGVFGGILTGQSETYADLIEAYIKDPVEKQTAYNAIYEIPTVSKKLRWANRWIDEGNFPEKIVAFAVVEGILFSATFAYIFWLRHLNVKMPGLFFANDEIATDENTHYQFAVHYYKNYLENKLPNDTLKSIILEGYEIERQYVEDYFEEGIKDMNKEDMIQFVQYTTDCVLQDFGLPKEFNVRQPFVFMQSLVISGRTNFFERKSDQYSKLEDSTLNLDELENLNW